jgi:hypothetical protein
MKRIILFFVLIGLFIVPVFSQSDKNQAFEGKVKNNIPYEHYDLLDIPAYSNYFLEYSNSDLILLQNNFHLIYTDSFNINRLCKNFRESCMIKIYKPADTENYFILHIRYQ